MSIRRFFPSILTDRLHESRAFYVGLLGFEVAFESNWFVHLVAPQDGLTDGVFELGLIELEHETIPEDYQRMPSGVLLTAVVEDVDAVHAKAQKLGLFVVEPPRNMFYGQRRMLLADPNGQLVDVSSLLEGRKEP